MKFGSQLALSAHSEWKFQYVDYDELKKLLKTAEEKLGFSDRNETLFVTKLENELEKVNQFCLLKKDELSRRVNSVEEMMETMLAEKTGQNWQRLEEETSRITAQVAELSRFIRLNYSAFLKVRT
jgi:SPX domain protein involved in polyphosphate accumulation